MTTEPSHDFNYLYGKHAADNNKDRFQQPLADFIAANNLELIVETGSGLSSLCIIKALEQRGHGKLISIDPEPFCQYEIEHPFYKLIKKKSTDAMAQLHMRTGAWDLFLHDSDHDILCQTYEFEMAHACTKKGGWICSDDYEWNQHFAWNDFILRHKLAQVQIGNIVMVQKIADPITMPIKTYSAICLDFAKGKEAIWLAAGNKNTWDSLYPETRKR